jgi:hypothetical protein
VPGSLVERGQRGRQIGGVALLGRQRPGPGRELAQRLGPARGGVGDHDGVVAHVAEVLRHGHAAVDARLAGHHRHVRRVGDDDRALGQRGVGPWVDQLTQVCDDVGHLVAALAASDVDDDVGVAPLRDLLQQHRLARAEPAGHGRRAAPGHRVEQVDDPLPGDQPGPRVDPLTGRTGPPHRPVLGQAYRLRLGVLGLHPAHHGVPGVLALGDHVGEPAAHTGGNEDLDLDRPGSPDGGQHRAGRHDRALAGLRHQVPGLLRRDVGTGRTQPRAGAGQRSQQTVDDGSEQPRTERGSQRCADRSDGRAGPEASGVLVGLHRRHPVAERHDLPGEAVPAQLDELGHGQPRQVLDLHQGTGHPDDPATPTRRGVGHGVHNPARSAPIRATTSSARSVSR